MRPDPHKKKYTGNKKRGGQGSGKGAGRGAEKGARRKTDEEEGQRGAQAAPGRPQQRDQEEVKEEAPQDEDQIERKSYRRRKIESNWQRYEDVHENAEVEPVEPLRGADFKELLKQAGDALTQFRLQDEMAWEDDEAESAPASDLMSLDCQDLAAALRCVPLHVRLGIQDTVSGDLVKQFEEEAGKHRTTYKPAIKEVQQLPEADEPLQSSIVEEAIDDMVPVFDIECASPGTDSANRRVPVPSESTAPSQVSQEKAHQCTKGEQGSPTRTNIAHESNTKADVNKGSNAKQEKHKKSTTDEVEASSSKVMQNAGSAVSKPQEVDDELDFLLGLATPSKSSSSAGEHTESVKHSPKAESAKGGHVIADTASSSLQSSKPAVNIQPGKTDNLEDWLDSVLED